MDFAKISASGQVTIPIEIRKKLNLKEGDKILFFERCDGEVVINNASATAIASAQRAFEGAAEDFSVSSEEDIQWLVDEERYSKNEPNKNSVQYQYIFFAFLFPESQPTKDLFLIIVVLIAR